MVREPPEERLRTLESRSMAVFRSGPQWASGAVPTAVGDGIERSRNRSGHLNRNLEDDPLSHQNTRQSKAAAAEPVNDFETRASRVY